MPISPAYITRLLQIPVFRGLTEAEAAEFFSAATELNVGPGAVLFKEGDAGDGLLIILEGDVAITRKTVELAKLPPNSVLGEMSLVGGETRSATAAAIGAVKVLKVPATAVQAMIAKASPAALKVVANIAQVLSKRLAAINEKFVESYDKTRKKEELADFGKILNNWSF